jgi:hypothetical protein
MRVTEAGAIPARSRHCNGDSKHVRLEMPLTNSREGEPRAPEPGDASRPRHFNRPSMEGLVA